MIHYKVENDLFSLFFVEKRLARRNCLIACLLVCLHYTDWSKNSVKTSEGLFFASNLIEVSVYKVNFIE
jgi:hypothetical protein